MFKWIKNQKGNSLIGTIVVLTTLAASSAAIVNLTGTDIKSAANSMQKIQAGKLIDSCFAYAMSKLNAGESPNVTDKPFGNGTFTVTSNPSSSSVTCTAKVGDATETATINTDFATDCVDLIVEDAHEEGAYIRNIKLKKNQSCNKNSTLSKIYMTWNWGNCAVGVNCDGSEFINGTGDEGEQYEDVGDPPHGKFWICHVPGGDHSAATTEAVSIMQWIFNHNMGTGSHGDDYLGACIISSEEESSEEVALMTCEATNESNSEVEVCSEDDGGAYIDQVVLESTTIFEHGAVPTELTTKTSSGEVTDVADAIMTEDGNYTLDVRFTQDIPLGSWFTITAEFADGSSHTGIFKLGNVEVVEEDDGDDEVIPEDDGFEVEDGVVIVDPEYQVDVEAIGSAITCGAGGPTIPVTADICINSNCSGLFDDEAIEGGESFSTTNSVPDSQYTVRATAALASCGSFSATYESTQTLQVWTLEKFDEVPETDGFANQQSIEEFLQGYVDENGLVNIADNQVIMLFELGMKVTNSNDLPAEADFQDLVILMTITEVAD